MTTGLDVLALGYLSIDTIITPGGAFGPVPGGAALYAALGARAAGARAGIAAARGQDYPPAWLDELAALGIDLSGILARSGPTRSARLTYDLAGGRLSPHFDDAVWDERTRHLAPHLPRDLRGVARVAIGPAPVDSAQVAVERARAGGVPAVADTSGAFARRAPEALLALLAGLEVFAPSLEETRLLVPGMDDDAAAVLLAARGTHVLQKRGAAGAFLVLRGAATGTRILPGAAPCPADPTGAGDATVGALAAYLAQGLAVEDAATRAMRIGAATVGAVGPVALGLARWAEADLSARSA